jgi:molecular chaperone DnaK (HSP70)
MQPGNRLEAVKRLFASEDEVTIGKNTLRVEEVAALFFRHMQQRATAAGVLEPLDAAVVTIPANSRGKARYRTKVSAGLAGIEVLALINEPTAAAMAHARALGQNERILVFDWGGGTLDVTVLQAIEGTFIEQASRGIQRLGGMDIDREFFKAVRDLAGGSEAWSEAERNTFKLDLERAKIQLSSQSSTQIRYPNGQFREVGRAEFEEAIRPLVERTREPVETCLRDSPGPIDHLVMVGGSSKMPVIQRFVSDIVRTDVSVGIDPMTAIAEGAAVASGILAGTIDDLASPFRVFTPSELGASAKVPVL